MNHTLQLLRHCTDSPVLRGNIPDTISGKCRVKLDFLSVRASANLVEKQCLVPEKTVCNDDLPFAGSGMHFSRHAHPDDNG